MSLILFFINFFGLLLARLTRGCQIGSLSVSYKALKGACVIETLNQVNIDGASKIGSYTYIGQRSSITKSTVGRYCSIANNFSIGQGEHNLGKMALTPFIVN
jgi:UDP-3-O-[3-hydroxymyristoyl] glucosamine N-acyltransferase